MADDLGDRMKSYEAHENERRFLPMLPVYARIDGRCFSSFTRGMKRPYDQRMIDTMVWTTKDLVRVTHARIGYTQSDEISLVWQGDRYDSAIFFDGRVMKMTSVLAALATAHFTAALEPCGLGAFADRMPHFDCRVVQLPTRIEAANAILWREQDATKNAVSMAARSMFSHRDLDHKNGPQMQEMMFSKGVNFNDYPAQFKRGTFVRRVTVEKALGELELLGISEDHRPPLGATVARTEIHALDMPRFGSVINRVAVVFDGAEPDDTSGDVVTAAS